MTDPGKRVDSWLPTKDWKRLRIAAKQEGMSQSAFVQVAIRRHLFELAERPLPDAPIVGGEG